MPNDKAASYCNPYEFNRLDKRPEPLLPKNPTFEQLHAAFPFLFKFSRVLALHPKKSESEDPGHPSGNGDNRWLVKIKPHSDTLPPLGLECFFTLSHAGCFALWYFKPQASPNAVDSGIYPFKLKKLDSRPHPSSSDNCIDLQLADAPEMAHPRLLVLRVVQSTDEDGWHTIRIETPWHSHRITLDLTTLSTEQPAWYRYELQAPDPRVLSNGYQQVGGWNGTPAYHWNDRDGKLLRGAPRAALHTESYPLDFRINAATEGDGLLVAGGEHRTFYVCENDQWSEIEGLRGHVAALDIIPATCTGGNETGILATCDDNTLYILNKKGSILQKVIMPGRVYGILLLAAEPGQWVDVALVVRTRGLYCARLFLDRLAWEKADSEPDRARYRELLWQEYFSDNPLIILEKWLTNKQEAFCQPMAVVALLYRPTQETIDLFSKPEVINKINDNVADFLLHTIRRHINHALEQDCADSLKFMMCLLKHLIQGPCCTRMAVRELEGYLVNNRPQWQAYEAVADEVEDIIRMLPDAKRNLIKQASQVCRAIDPKSTKEALGLFVSVCERLRADKLFNEIILFPHSSKLGVIRAVCIIGKRQQGVWSHVHLYSNSNTLSAFNDIATAEKVEPQENPAWQHELSQSQASESNRLHQPFRDMVPFDDTRLVLIAGNTLGIAREGKRHIAWLRGADYPLRALLVEYSAKLPILVAGEWKRHQGQDTPPLLYAFTVENDAIIPLSHDFPAPSNQEKWPDRLIIRALAWDDKGGLWGVTWHEGYLLHWPDPCAEPAKVIRQKTLNIALYTVVTWEDLVVCGGEDGIVRAFTHSGELRWTFVANGIIRSIRVVRRQRAVNEPDVPVFAVISEQEHLWTLTREGKQCGLLYMPHVHPTALFSCVLYPDDPHSEAHHLVGTLEGEIRLVEEAFNQNNHWHCRTYLSEHHPQGLNWKNMSPVIEGNCNNTFSDKIFLYSWSGTKSSGIVEQEPLRAAWAIRQLLEKHRDYHAVILALQHITAHELPSVRRFRAQAFAALGTHLQGMPSELRPEFYRLCDKAKDGAIAALILAVSDEASLRDSELLAHIMRKIETAKPFTTAALLQIIRNSTFKSLLEKILIRALEAKKNQLAEYHTGFIEGLLISFFQAVSLKKGLLTALVSIDGIFPTLAGKLRTNRNKRMRFYSWLNRYSANIFPANEYAAWQILQTHLKTAGAEFNVEGFNVDQVWMDAGQMDNKSQDYQAFELLLSHFPKHLFIARPASDTMLIERLMPLGAGLKEVQTNIQSGKYTAPKIKNKLSWYQEELKGFKPQCPLLQRLQRAWQTAWQIELDRLAKTTLPQTLLEYLQLIVEPVLFVKGEPAPLQVRLRNIGHQDLETSIRLYFDDSAWNYLDNDKTPGISTQRLRCATESSQGQTLSLQTYLLPPFDNPIQLKICWEVGRGEACQMASKTVTVPLKPRWSEYAATHPIRDTLAMRLFGKKAADGVFAYRRIIIRCWRGFEPEWKPKELLALAKDWAERSGRAEDLHLFTPEPGWPQTQKIQNWQARLLTPPTELEVWFITEAVAWNLNFLEILDQSEATALLLPQLVVEEDLNKSQKRHQTQLLDEILSLRGRNQFAVLQWGLKACVQGVCEIAANRARTLPPAKLAGETPHGKNRIARGVTPSLLAWQDPQQGTHWLVAGINQVDYQAHLPPDPVKPLGALLPDHVFRSLYRMGLIQHWGDMWIPRAALLFDYIDELHPTQVAFHTPPRRFAWTWQTDAWRMEKYLLRTRQVLFGKRDREPSFAPYEGFDFQDWAKLKAFTRHTTLPGEFYLLLGLESQQDYQTIQDSQQQWQQLMTGHSTAHPLLLKQLKNGKIEVTPFNLATVHKTLFNVFTLQLRQVKNRFERLLLIIPTPDFHACMADISTDDVTGKTTLLDDLLREIKASNGDKEWQSAVMLMLYELPSALRKHSLMRSHDVVFVDARGLNRLLSSRKPVHETLIQIIQAQIPVGELAHKIFHVTGPVPYTRFFGRVAGLRLLTEGLLSGKSFVITGPRGIGKSSLLRYIPHSPLWQRLEPHFMRVFLDLQDQRGGSSYVRFLESLVKQNDINLSDALAAEVAGLAVADQHVPGPSTEQAIRLAEQVLDAIEAQAAPRIPLYMLDEVDGFYQYDHRNHEPLFTRFRARHNQGSARFLFSSYPPQAESMAAAITDARNQTYNFVESLVLEPLEPGEGMELVQTGMHAVGVKISDPQAGWITDAAFAIPNLLQKACLEFCQGLQHQIEQEERYDIGEALIKTATNKASAWFLDTFFVQLKPQELKYALFGLLLEERYLFTLEEAMRAFQRHAGAGWSKERVKQALKELLHTLILKLEGGNYRFSGPAERPYFPTLVWNAYTKDELESYILTAMIHEDTH